MLLVKMTDGVGLVLAKMSDKLSILAHRVFGYEWSVVGFYYKSMIMGTNQVHLTLIRAHDAKQIPWHTCTLDSLIDNSMVYHVDIIRLKLASSAEKRFRAIVAQTLSQYNTTGYSVLNEVVKTLTSADCDTSDHTIME